MEHQSERLSPSEVDYVIYHNPCSDGHMSMTIVRDYLEGHFPDRAVTYHGASINAPPPDDLEGKCLLICDYSYPKDILMKLLTVVKKLLILDHHKTSQEALADIPDTYKVFDMKKSGASLTWEYFHMKLPSPLLVQYVEDRDIWKNQLPHSDSFGIWWYSVPLEYEIYKKYMEDDTLLLEHIQQYGPICSQYARSQMDTLSQYASVRFTKLRNKKYYFIVYVNSSSFISDLGNLLIKKYQLADFTAVYIIYENDTSKFCLRSTDTNADCSEVAKLYGGGGHRNASGCNIDVVTNILPGRVYDDSTLYNRLSTIYTEMRYGHNVLYIYTPQHKYALASYLLQIKYADVQNADHILSEKCGSKTYTVAIAWDYDALDNKTYFLMVTHKDIKDIQSVRDTFGFDSNGKTNAQGLHKTLPCEEVMLPPCNGDVCVDLNITDM